MGGQELAWEARWAQERHKHDRYLQRELLRSFKQRLEIEAFENARQTQLVEILRDCQSQVFQQYRAVDSSSDESAALVSAAAPPATPSGAFLPSTATLQERDTAMTPNGPDPPDLYPLFPLEEGYVDPSDMEMYFSLFSPEIDGNRHFVSAPGYEATSLEMQSSPASGGHLGAEGRHPTLDNGKAKEDDGAVEEASGSG